MTLRLLTALALFSPTVSGIATAQDSPNTPNALSLEQRASYVIGLSLGRNLKEQDVDLDTELLLQGLRDALTGAKPRLSEQEAEATMQAFSTAFAERQQAKARAASEKNLKEGQAFLDANKAKPGVKTTASGLQYKIIEPGKGESPKATDTVRVHYRGTLIDGTEFDSSYARNEPAVFPLNGVIPGWTEGLQLIKPGGKIQLVIPANLAYGERGAPGGQIGPNAVLVFDIELLDVVK
ncbi:MAG: peptidyl-prolyl cis-trans isomerase [Isosphaeraceae bacterium]|jgi:FKBP-type peptidyl-prolyl cis-trans isomerase|nr:MAG: peptidyl-prolyl cis-trans isomerase [Isosphaeraceae bacterium]